MKYDFGDCLQSVSVVSVFSISRRYYTMVWRRKHLRRPCRLQAPMIDRHTDIELSTEAWRSRWHSCHLSETWKLISYHPVGLQLIVRNLGVSRLSCILLGNFAELRGGWFEFDMTLILLVLPTDDDTDSGTLKGFLLEPALRTWQLGSLGLGLGLGMSLSLSLSLNFVREDRK